jgi:hypothetical protein
VVRLREAHDLASLRRDQPSRDGWPAQTKLAGVSDERSLASPTGFGTETQGAALRRLQEYVGDDQNLGAERAE